MEIKLTNEKKKQREKKRSKTKRQNDEVGIRKEAMKETGKEERGREAR